MIYMNGIHRNMTGASEDNRRGIKTSIYSLVALFLLFSTSNNTFGQAVSTSATAQVKTPLKTWIDSSTGHRVTRLSDEPNSVGLYFDVNAYTPDGKDMIYVSPKGIYDLNLSTLKAEIVVSGKLGDIIVGTKTRRVFYENYNDGHYYVADIDTKQVTQLPNLPARGHVSSVNSDETLLAGMYVEGVAPDFDHYKLLALKDALKTLGDNRQAMIDARKAEALAHPEEKSSRNGGGDAIAKANADASEKRFSSHTPEDIFTFNIQTGEVKTILKGTDWLNHVQFSPTDPTLLMYAHEGPSLKVDRVWTIRADGSNNKLIRQRNDPSEIATHEFWSHDGKTIWYDLQTAKGEDFAIGGYKVETGKEVSYHMNKAEASVHYNISTNDRFFCSDGNQSAHDNKAGIHGHMMLKREWIKILRPFPDDSLHSIRLADLSKNDYARSEPNARFSPDNKMVIFTSNMFGPNYIFAVEVGKAKTGSTTSTSATN